MADQTHHHTTATEESAHPYDALVPTLIDGDTLTRDEFERRYHAMPHIKKAELLSGVVHMPSPVHFAHHGKPHSWIIWWLGSYIVETPGVEMADNTTLRLPGAEDEVQPDALLLKTHGGAARISADDYVEGAPELIVEIACSSAENDSTRKRTIYHRNGVQEYLVWHTQEARIDWWELREGEYTPLPTSEHGIIASRAFPGLWLDTAAMLAGNLSQVRTVLQQGLATDAHAACALHSQPDT